MGGQVLLLDLMSTSLSSRAVLKEVQPSLGSDAGQKQVPLRHSGLEST